MPALSQPQFTRQDPNDVDLLSATAYLHETDVSIGSKEHPLMHTWYSGPDGTWTWDYPQFVPLQSTGEMDSFAPAFISWPNYLALPDQDWPNLCDGELGARVRNLHYGLRQGLLHNFWR